MASSEEIVAGMGNANLHAFEHCGHCGHGVHRDDPEQAEAVLRRFLAD